MQRNQKKIFLDLNHVFGSNFALPIKNQIGFIQQDGKIKLVYTAGKSVVKKTINSNLMQFIRLSQNIQNIQCMAISPTRNHISICQKIKNENFLLLNLYGLKNRDSQIKHFKLPQTQKQSSFKVIAFSPSQPKYVCCMTSQPDSQLMFLDISRSRGLAVSNFSVQGAQSLSICPTQSHLISCAGKNIFKLFKVQDYSFKAYQQVKKLPKTRNFTSHAWFDKTKILVGTDRGQLFMVGPVGNNFQVKRHFNNVFAIQTIQQISVTSICVFSKGFILGSSKGNFSLWVKKQQDQQNFQDEYTGDLVKKWKMSQDRSAQVSSIAICTKQQNIAVSFKNNSIALTTMDILMSSEQSGQSNDSLQDQVLAPLYGGFHMGSIDCMDVCMHRPIIATLSKKQNIVRLWNYKQPNCQLVKKFDAKFDGIQQLGSSQLINCLALHPLGYYMAIGCCDKLRFYHILQSGLRNYRQIVLRGVVQVKFSNGGHLLAVGYPRQKHNIHQINIYNSYNLQQIARLSDHSNIITDLFWRQDDKYLYSVSIDGTAVQWKYNQSRQNKQWTCKKWNQNNGKYTSIIYQKSSKSILIAGTQLNKCIIRQIKTQKDQNQKLFSMGFRINKLQWLTSQWNISSIIAGTEDGCIKIFNSSFDNIVEQTLNVHMKQITNIKTSPCGRYVFTASKDGLIFIYQVTLTNKQGFVTKRLHDQTTDYQLNPLVGVLDDQLADIVLVQRNDINEKLRYTKLLQKNLQQMKRKLIIQDDQQYQKNQTQLKKISAQKQYKIDKLTEQLENVKNQKKILQGQFQTNFINFQSKNQKMFQDIQNLYEKKLAIQNKKYFDLQKQYEQQQKKQQLQIKKLNQKTGNTIQILKKQFIECFKKAQKVHLTQQDAIISGQKGFSQKLNQIQEQHQNQLKKISFSIAQMQNHKTKKSAQYANIIQSLKRDCRMLNEQIVQYMSDNDHLKQITHELKYQLDTVNNTMQMKKKQLLQKKQNLKIRQQKIGVFQQKISQLQKKKQVLSFRTWQMRQQIQPKQDQIQFLKQQIFNIQSQFQHLLSQQRTITQLSQKLKKQKQNLIIQIQKQKTLTKDKKGKIKKICDDINQIVNNKKIQDKKLYQKQIEILWKNYGNLLTQGKRNNTNVKGFEQLNRHMDHLDKQIDDVNKKTQFSIKRRDVQIQKTTQQNADLIKQLAKFRQQKQQLHDELKNLHKISQSLKRQTQQLKNISNKQENNNMNMSAIKKNPSSKVLPPPNINNKHLSSITNHNISPQNILNATQPSSSNMMVRSSSQPLHKGKLVKGINYDTQSLSIFSKAKLKQLDSKLQMSKLNYHKKQILLKFLKQKIYSHLKNQCRDQMFEKVIEDYQI